MAESDTLERIKDVVARTFDTPRDALEASSSALDVDGWDSVSHAMLVLELEDEFGISIDFSEALEAENLAQLADYVDRTRA